MPHETYKLTAPDKDIRYLYFPRGKNHDYHEMECIKPLHLGENGYNETDIRIRQGICYAGNKLRKPCFITCTCMI